MWMDKKTNHSRLMWAWKSQEKRETKITKFINIKQSATNNSDHHMWSTKIVTQVKLSTDKNNGYHMWSTKKLIVTA